MTTDERPVTVTLRMAPGHLLRRAERVHTREWTGLVGSEPTSPQFALLSVVAWQPGIDQGTAGEIASLDSSTTADIVSRLVRKGWLYTQLDPTDRRRKHLHLERDSRTGLRSITRRAAKVQERLLKSLPPDEAGACLAQLGQLAYEGDPPEGGERRGAVGLTLAKSPGHLIRRAQQVHLRHWADVVGSEVTGPQYAVLAVVATSGSLDQVSVEQRAGLDRSTVGAVTARLVARDLLVATPHPGDRRRKRLHLSTAAIQRLPELSSRVDEVQRRLMDPVPRGRRRRLITQLRLVAQVD